MYCLYLLLLFISITFGTLCPEMQSGGGTWYCVPCGGDYSCSYSGDEFCYADATDLSCSLPFSASDWLCCEDCNV